MNEGGLFVETLMGGYGDRYIVDDISFTAAPGTITLVAGRNGSGKSTLLRGIMRLLPNVSGSIIWNGENVEQSPWKLRRKGVVYIPQRQSVFLRQSVMNNLVLSGSAFVPDVSDINIKNALRMFPVLRDRTDVAAANLSGGERRQLAIACAIVSEPKLLLADEPTAGLAKPLAIEIFNHLRALADRGVSVVLVAHDVENALKIANYVLGLRMGQTVCHCKVDEFDSEKQKAVFLS